MGRGQLERSLHITHNIIIMPLFVVKNMYACTIKLVITPKKQVSSPPSLLDYSLNCHMFMFILKLVKNYNLKNYTIIVCIVGTNTNTHVQYL